MLSQVDQLTDHVRFAPAEPGGVPRAGVLEHTLMRHWAACCTGCLRLRRIGEDLRSSSSRCSQARRAIARTETRPVYGPGFLSRGGFDLRRGLAKKHLGDLSQADELSSFLS